VWVEKILDPGEPLRDWPVDGTVGYEFLNDAAALFVDPAGEAPLTELWQELSGDERPFGEWAAEAKLEQAHTTFAPDVDRLRRAWPEAEGLEEALAALPVYRTYIRDLPAPEDLHVLREAGLVEWLAQAPREFVIRFQQTTPPVMAKGVEDTAFYRYVRLLALCDVGGDPSRWSIGVEAFHAGNAERAERFPRTMLTSQTHDTKRSGDARARIGALAAIAEDWAAAVRGWRELCAPLREDGAPDAVEEYTIFQTLVATWPIDRDRLCAYMEKALREAKRNTAWVDGDPEWERRVMDYCRALYDHAPFREAFDPLAERVAVLGELHSLRQTALKLTVPGIPDTYQGDELVSLSLVDPDNRRPVDWERRRELLAQLRDGAAPDSRDARKLWLTRELLALRARRPDAFAGAYAPLEAGADAVAFLRGDEVAVAMPIREGGLDTGRLVLPAGSWRPAFDPELLPGAQIHVFERG
jgi:(1->4)-alpha-D-glucan 1-alpha-D-glucosylmutase